MNLHHTIKLTRSWYVPNISCKVTKVVAQYFCSWNREKQIIEVSIGLDSTILLNTAISKQENINIIQTAVMRSTDTLIMLLPW